MLHFLFDNNNSNKNIVLLLDVAKRRGTSKNGVGIQHGRVGHDVRRRRGALEALIQTAATACLCASIGVEKRLGRHVHIRLVEYLNNIKHNFISFHHKYVNTCAIN